MAGAGMTGYVIPDGDTVYRAVRPSQAPEGKLQARAFLLKPNEPGLSVSGSKANAIAALDRIRNAAGLQVGAIRRLEHEGIHLGLDVTPQAKTKPPEDPHYAWIVGIPLYDADDEAGKMRANDFADALLTIANYPA